MGPRLSGSSQSSAARARATPPPSPGQAHAPHAVGGRPAPGLGESRLRPRPAGPNPALELHDRDIRRKRPPVLSFLLRMSTLRRMSRTVSLLALDFAGISLAIFTALVLKEALHDGVIVHNAAHTTREYVPFAYLVTALLFALSGQYAERALRPGLSSIVASLFQVAVVALIFAVVNGEHFSSYYIFYGSLAVAVLYVSSLRGIYEKITAVLLRAAGYQRRAVLVGRGKHIADVAHALKDAASSPIEVVGYLSPLRLPDIGVRSLGTLGDLAAVLTYERIDEVIIADPEFPQDDAVELVDRCHQRGVRVRLAPSTMEILIHRAEFLPGQSLPLFELGPPVFEGVDFALKRTFDIIGATLLLLLLSPVLLAIAAAVRLSSRGPVLYRSMRRGIGQRPFPCLKFRTMHTNAEELQADLEAMNEASGALFKIREDPRLTKVGRQLRRFSLDELPQLLNVLRGEMSLVGPRPLPERDYAMLEDWHRKRYLVLPGITGLWQVSGRSELDFDDLVHLDFIYLERWSLALDLTILVKTIPAVLSRRGAF
ncbi:MAG TPA: sugar transferase [Solirubrobacteraceae bacterium]|jgi:exopolysaccharide biosynthesis polyprenyl glycosylphosphotransferase|nr:sugar transferase [Solirubrobacteraceae bacterium]